MVWGAPQSLVSEGPPSGQEPGWFESARVWPSPVWTAARVTANQMGHVSLPRSEAKTGRHHPHGDVIKAFSYLSRLVASMHPAPQPRTDCLSSSGPSTWTPDLCPLWLLDSYLSFKVQLSGPLLPEVRVGTEDTVANKTDRMLPFCHPLT